MTRLARLTAPAIAVAVLTLAASAGGVAAGPAAHADGKYVAITGSGSTWSQNALDQWRSNVKNNYGIVVNYAGQGSTAGRRDFIQATVDFAVSEIPFQRQPDDGSAAEIPTVGYAYMPIVAGGTSLMYNLKIGGQRVTNLRLSGPVIARIFTCAITRWNDPAIQADNPGLAMPDREIIPVIRADGSGTSAQFSLWLSKTQGDTWKHGMKSQFPSCGKAKAQSQSLGVAGYVAQNYGEGAITYVEYSYALKAGFPVAKVLNAAGYYIEPTASSVAVALTKARINPDQSSPDYLTQILDDVYAFTDPRVYPLSSYSYMILPTEVAGTFNLDKGYTLGTFANYFLCEGQQQADQLGYSPLPMNLVQAGLDQVKRIPGAASVNVDINRCNNPTFKPGDDPANNQLARTAPQPQECDKVGTGQQCTGGTAGARQETPKSNTGATNDSTTNDNTTNDDSTTNDNATDDSTTTDELVYDADGVLLSTSSRGNAQATASPQDLVAPAWDTWQTLFVLAVVLVVVVVAVPAGLPLLLAKRRGGVDTARKVA